MQTTEQTGRLLKVIGGFYYVEAADAIYECKARGVFRKQKESPLAGDLVRIGVREDGSGTILEIFPRKNELIRPPVSNLDQLLIVAATRDPSPSTLVIDKMIAAAVYKEIAPVLVITKSDLDDTGPLEEIYRRAGVRTIVFSAVTRQGLQELQECLSGKISAFTGNSGVGKSSLLNCVDSRLTLKTGDISKKLGRGRHTTRQVELFRLPQGGYVADTPGFSTVDLERYEIIRKDALASCFEEFLPYLGRCRFTSCSHTCEKGCAVLDAVTREEIHPSRHESYKAMYREVKDLKEWELK